MTASDTAALVLAVAANVVCLALVARMWRHSRRQQRSARALHPSVRPPLAVALVPAGGRSDVRIDALAGSPPLAVDIVSFRHADPEGAWESAPLVDRVEIEPGGHVQAATTRPVGDDHTSRRHRWLTDVSARGLACSERDGPGGHSDGRMEAYHVRRFSSRDRPNAGNVRVSRRGRPTSSRRRRKEAPVSAMSFHGSQAIGRVSRLLVPSLLAIFVGGMLTGGTPAHGAVGPIVFVADLSGPAEDPPNASPGTGSARVAFDPVADTMRVQFEFEGLVSDLTVAHIHACTAVPSAGNAGVATQLPTFVGTPAGTTSGSYDTTFVTTDASTYNPDYVTAHGSPEAAETALLACLEFGGAYLNLHSTTYPGGEIRGFLLLDTDDDGTADSVDLDDDGDGQTDADEIECGSDPLDPASTSPDADGDGIPDCVDPTPDPTTTTAPTTTTTTVAPSGTLPTTGRTGSGTAVGALVLVVAGAWLMVAARRPRRT